MQSACSQAGVNFRCSNCCRVLVITSFSWDIALAGALVSLSDRGKSGDEKESCALIIRRILENFCLRACAVCNHALNLCSRDLV